jgi:predicted DCC family thiol-disulfide oxidoreductase YuxK
MARIQARTADGEWLDGVEVFRQLYGAVGLEPVMGLTRLPGVSHALEAAYDVFAKNRLRLTGRAGCDTSCAVSLPLDHPS